jgi:hypothetical protein
MGAGQLISENPGSVLRENLKADCLNEYVTSFLQFDRRGLPLLRI